MKKCYFCKSDIYWEMKDICQCINCFTQFLFSDVGKVCIFLINGDQINLDNGFIVINKVKVENCIVNKTIKEAMQIYNKLKENIVFC